MTKTDKKTVRKLVRDQKRQLTEAQIKERTEKILDILRKMEFYEKAERIYLYVNYNQEVNTSILIDEGLKEGKEIFVPRVDGEQMNFYRIHSRDDLESGVCGILEPKAGCSVDTKHSGLMILPGLAFDQKHHRVGYGGGFYDRYLEKYPDFYKAALCYDFQVFMKIETEESDIPVDIVISESAWF